MTLAAFNRYMTAGDIISQVGVDVGLPVTVDPFQSQDAQYQRLITQLNLSGNALLTLYPWARITQTGTIVTQPGVGEYDLPLDFSSMIPSTTWRKDQNFVPGYGTVSAQTWEYLVNVPIVGTINVIYRERYGKITVLPKPTQSFSFTYEYISRGWVQNVPGESPVLRDNVIQASDLVLFDPLLISRYLKMRWLKSTGFDASDATDEFNLLLDNRSSTDTSKPKLSAAGVLAPLGAPLISIANIPQTGYGSSGGM
jgi:hypothetical protein